jgi:hypothetical protein
VRSFYGTKHLSTSGGQKDEPSLSDYSKGFLQRDLKDRGIVVNREVEVYRPAGAGKGPATDIHVDVIVPKPHDQLHLKAIIEVKGCWNPHLKTSIQAQLIEKYLRTPIASMAYTSLSGSTPRIGTTPIIEEKAHLTGPSKRHANSLCSKPLSTRRQRTLSARSFSTAVCNPPAPNETRGRRRSDVLTTLEHQPKNGERRLPLTGLRLPCFEESGEEE